MGSRLGLRPSGENKTIPSVGLRETGLLYVPPALSKRLPEAGAMGGQGVNTGTPRSEPAWHPTVLGCVEGDNSSGCTVF